MAPSQKQVEAMSSVSAVNTLLASTTTTTPAISLSNILASVAGATTPGIDVTSAVAAGIYADRAPERVWQADQVTLTSQTTALTAIQTATEALATDMQSLNTLAGPLAARTVTSSNSNDLTATAATGTVAGVHTVIVNSVATTGSWYSDLETGPTALLPASSMTITTTAGPAATIAIGSGVNTLNDLATAINSATSTTSYSSTQASLTAATPLTAGSITTIQDTATGKTFSYTAASGDTVNTLNTAIAAAVTAGTLSAGVTGSAATGQEVISEGSTGQGITVSTNDAALGAMGATAGATISLGLNATVVSDATGSRLAIISKASGTAADFSITSANYTGTSWTSPDIPSGSTLGANSVTLTSSAGTATISTTSGETYAQLATAINSATIATSYASAQTGLNSTAPLTAGSITTIQDTATGKTFSYTAAAGDTVNTLNTAIATAVTAGTLSAHVVGAVTGGKEVISEGLTDKGIVVSTNDAVLGAMGTTPGATTPLGLTATAGSDANGTNITIASTVPKTGTTPSFTINEPAFGFTQAVAAANASLTVDGVPISSANNSVTGAIPGVTLTLLGASLGSPISLTVASDAGQVSTAVNQFVTDYNTAIGLVNSQFNFTSTTDSSGNTTSAQGVLASDPAIRSLQSTLEQALNYVNAPTTGTTTVSTLNDLGISAGSDGSLTLDSATLNSALVNNPGDVQNFFEGASLNGFANSLNTALNAFTSPANGAFTVDLSSISASKTALTSEINDFETGYIASQQTLLTAEYSSAEIALQQLPTEMAQLDSELGLTPTNSNGG
jgi:flagellar hook-associated protein 2